MKIIADTNVLLRSLLNDDPAQGAIARTAMQEAEAVIVSQHTLCEVVWVLECRYKLSRQAISRLLHTLSNTERIVLDRKAMESGLSFLDAGGDFADGVIAYEGAWLGGETFVSFNKKAVSLLSSLGHKSKLLS